MNRRWVCVDECPAQPAKISVHVVVARDDIQCANKYHSLPPPTSGETKQTSIENEEWKMKTADTHHGSDQSAGFVRCNCNDLVQIHCAQTN